MAEVRKLLDSARLITMVGPAGIGKTRLALQVATELVSAYPDGVWFVDLAPLTDPRLVAGAVADTVGVAEQPGVPLADSLTAHLRSRDLLLVLDNCEHLVDGCIPLVESILRTTSQTSLLLTSRERLRVAGEVAWAVPPLRSPDLAGIGSLVDLESSEAARLFLARASAALPQVGMDDHDAGPIAQICSHLDGIPLAIELAAARVAMLTPAEIVDRLDDRFRLLTSSPHGEASRHATLRTALDWSYDLLDPFEQMLLRRLSVFAGTFSLSAAEAVGSGPLLKEDEVFDLLDSLVAKSLVLRERTSLETRFRLLETIRCYAGERLAATGEAPDAVARHVDFYLTTAEQVEPAAFGQDAKVALDRLEVEHDNFRVALQHVLADPTLSPLGLRLGHALFPLWEMRNHRTEGRATMEAVLADAPKDDVLASAVARRAGNLARSDSDEAAAERLWTQALDLARHAGDRRHLGRALVSAARAAHSRLDLAGARAMLEEAHLLAREVGDEIFIAESLIRLGFVAYDQARYEEAHRHGEAVRHQSDSWLNVTRALDILGKVARDRGDYDMARRCFEEGCRISGSVQDQLCHAEALDGLATVAAAEGRFDDARHAWEEALVLLRQGHRLVLVGPLGGLAMLAAIDGDHDTARSFLEEELAVARRNNDPADIARSLLRGAQVTADRGDHHDAVVRYVEVLTFADRAGMPWYFGASLHGLALSLGPAEQSVTLLGCADVLWESIGAQLPPGDGQERDRWVVGARVRMGSSVFDAAWATGRSAGVEETVALAAAVAAGERVRGAARLQPG